MRRFSVACDARQWWSALGLAATTQWLSSPNHRPPTAGGAHLWKWNCGARRVTRRAIGGAARGAHLARAERVHDGVEDAELTRRQRANHHATLCAVGRSVAVARSRRRPTRTGARPVVASCASRQSVRRSRQPVRAHLEEPDFARDVHETRHRRAGAAAPPPLSAARPRATPRSPGARLVDLRRVATNDATPMSDDDDNDDNDDDGTSFFWRQHLFRSRSHRFVVEQ